MPLIATYPFWGGVRGPDARAGNGFRWLKTSTGAALARRNCRSVPAYSRTVSETHPYSQIFADFGADLEKVLVDVGAVRNGDPRLQRNKAGKAEVETGKIRQGNTSRDDDDSDWD